MEDCEITREFFLGGRGHGAVFSVLEDLFSTLKDSGASVLSDDEGSVWLVGVASSVEGGTVSKTSSSVVEALAEDKAEIDLEEVS